MDIKTEIGKRIKEARVSKGYKQQPFAELLNKSQATISIMEKGKSILIEDIYSICKELKISADWLLFGSKEAHFTDEEKEFLRKYANLSEREKGRIDEIIDRSQQSKEIKKLGNL